MPQVDLKQFSFAKKHLYDINLACQENPIIKKFEGISFLSKKQKKINPKKKNGRQILISLDKKRKQWSIF